MITESEYNEIKPHRDNIVLFHTNGQYKGGEALHVANKLIQRYSMGSPVNFGCDGCKIAAMNDLYNLMIEYETANGI
ncbi:MAG: hypothetical protein A2Z57_12060 [Planctomycetes bacterium RIFCSPHIGHO2_12_39_6]|nr:MAG: hypothetical protein A2Z57_12060 [Planctomycetes bacterium RIFCSPHIGHO2_12_39_6]